MLNRLTVTLPGVLEPLICERSDSGLWVVRHGKHDTWVGIGNTIEAAILNKFPKYSTPEKSHAN